MPWDRMGAVTANTRAKADEIAAWSAKQGRPVRVAWGKVSNRNNGEHYSGRAVDFMTFADERLTRYDRAIGDGIVNYLLANRDRLGVYGIIWRQRLIGYSRGFEYGWQPMANRGNATANHMDHVHVWFSSADKAPGRKPATSKPKGQVWHVDPAKVSTFLWGLKGGTRKNIRARPRRNIRIARWTKRNGRTWGVTAKDNWFAKAYLKKGRA